MVYSTQRDANFDSAFARRSNQNIDSKGLLVGGTLPSGAPNLTIGYSYQIGYNELGQLLVSRKTVVREQILSTGKIASMQ